MNIRKLLKMKLFKDSILLTPELSLDRKIDSVMIIEALDVEKWAGKNQILLTSFVAFQNQPLEVIDLFFQKIAQIGVSGIIFKTKRIVETVPDFFIQLCDNYQIPLIEIPHSLTYESIILSIHEPLLNYESFLLKSYYTASKSFHYLASPRYTYEDMSKRFCQFTSLPISLSIPEQHFEFYAKDFQSLPKGPYVEYEVLNHYARRHYYIRTYHCSDTECHYLTIQNIIENHRYQFFIQLPNSTIDHSLILTIEKFLEILAQKLDSEYYRKNEKFLHHNKTISSILFGINRDSYDLELLLEEVDLFQHSHYQVLMIAFAKQTEPNHFKKVKKAIESSQKLHVYYESKNTLVYIFNVPECHAQLAKQDIKKNIPHIDGMQCFLSKVADYTQIQTLFETCIKMKQFNDSFYTGYIMDENDLGIFNFLITIPPEDYKHIIPQDLQSLFEENRELFQTLHSFILNHLNFGRTATELYLHPKTIRYRINKIEQLLQLDLRNPVQLTNYTIGCILLNLIAKEHSHDKTLPSTP